MSKNRTIVAYNELDVNRIKIEEVKDNEYSKYQRLSLPKYEHDDKTITTLFIKTPLLDFNIGGLPPSKDREGNDVFTPEEEHKRAKWRCYLGDAPEEKKLLEKMVEFQNKLIKDKSAIVGKKDEKKFELENIIGESTTKDGATLQYIRFNFRTEGAESQIATKFFVRKDGIDDEIVIKTPKEFEEKFRRGQFRYRMIVSLSKVWSQKKMPGKYGASFKVEQMLIEMKDDVSMLSAKTMFAKSQFDDDVVADKVEQKPEELDLSNNIEDDDEVEENKKVVAKDVQEEEEEEEVDTKDDEEEEEEIKPTKKATGVKVTATKAVRRK
jgi:hypothetical protein